MFLDDKEVTFPDGKVAFCFNYVNKVADGYVVVM
jgi:hypothetical protein